MPRVLALGDGGVRLRAEDVTPSAPEAVALTLERVAVHRSLSSEPSPEGSLVFDVGGQRTHLAWRKGAPESGAGGQLLYVGRPGTVLDIDAAMLESDADAAEALETLRAGLAALSGVAAAVPGAGAPVAAGLSLAASLLALVRAKLREQVELRFLGSLEPPASLGEGTYVLERVGADGRPEIEIALRVQGVELPAPPSRREVVLVLEAAEIELPAAAGDDVFVLDVAAEGGSPRRRRELHVEQELAYGGAWLDRTLGLRDALLYGGPWGEGLSLSLSTAVVPRAHLREVKDAIERASALAAALAPGHEAQAARSARAAEGVWETAVKLLPGKRLAASRSALLLAGPQLAAAPGDCVVSVPLGPDWQRFSLALSAPGSGRAVLHLGLRAAG